MKIITKIPPEFWAALCFTVASYAFFGLGGMVVVVILAAILTIAPSGR